MVGVLHGSSGAGGLPGRRTEKAFGDSVELADELLALVLHGPKRATAGLVAEFTADEERLPRIGGHWIVCDGRGVPQAVLRTVGLRLGVVESVDDAFAWDEGEGDRTRADWLRGQRVCGSGSARRAAWSSARTRRSSSSASGWSGRPSTPTDF